jgi:hypothetical protein
MFEPPAGLVGKRSISVVDIEDVVGRGIVGDIDVRPAVLIQVGDGYAESITGNSQYARFGGRICERALAAIPVELVVTAAGLATSPRVAYVLTTRKIPG